MTNTTYFLPIPRNGYGYSEPRKQVGNRIFSWYMLHPQKKKQWNPMCSCDTCLNRLWDDDIFRRVKRLNAKDRK